jgi:hypothetical protein
MDLCQSIELGAQVGGSSLVDRHIRRRNNYAEETRRTAKEEVLGNCTSNECPMRSPRLLGCVEVQ